MCLEVAISEQSIGHNFQVFHNSVDNSKLSSKICTALSTALVNFDFHLLITCAQMDLHQHFTLRKMHSSRRGLWIRRKKARVAAGSVDKSVWTSYLASAGAVVAAGAAASGCAGLAWCALCC